MTNLDYVETEVMECAMLMALDILNGLELEEILDKAYGIVCNCGVSDEFDWGVLPA